MGARGLVAQAGSGKRKLADDACGGPAPFLWVHSRKAENRGSVRQMDNRTNTIAGWTLAACGLALGLSIVGGMAFHSERPEKMGYAIEGVEEAGGGGEAAAVPIATLLPTADVAKGAEVFKKCAACHNFQEGAGAKVGPDLYGIVGRPVASAAGAFTVERRA